MKTVRERLAAALEARGCRVVEKTKKRWKLTVVDRVGATTSDKFYFIGSSGALRVGRIFSQALSLTGGPLYKELLK